MSTHRGQSLKGKVALGMSSLLLLSTIPVGFLSDGLQPRNRCSSRHTSGRARCWRGHQLLFFPETSWGSSCKMPFIGRACTRHSSWRIQARGSRQTLRSDYTGVRPSGHRLLKCWHRTLGQAWRGGWSANRQSRPSRPHFSMPLGISKNLPILSKTHWENFGGMENSADNVFFWAMCDVPGFQRQCQIPIFRGATILQTLER